MAYLIGQLAEAAEVNVETVRFYERRGLIDDPPRSESGYRNYPEKALNRLIFIRNAQRIGFSLKEIDRLLSLSVVAGGTGSDVREAAETKIAQIDEKIAVLEKMRTALIELKTVCRHDKAVSECHFIEVLKHQENS